MEQIKGLGHKDALLVLSTIANDESAEIGFRVGAATALAPFQHPKLQSIPTPRFIDLQLDIPEFTHVSDAENFLAKIALLVARGHLDIQSGQELSALVKTWIDSQYQKEELQFKISPPETRDTTIRVEGGLPALPGTSITMPVLNGHAVSEQLLAAPTDVVPAENEFSPTPGELKAQGPHPLQKHHFAAPEAAPRQNSTNGQGEATHTTPETQDQGTT
jgi:hypothetical protein